MIVEFSVSGKPITQGSKRAIRGRYMRDTSDEATKHQPANRLKSWRSKIRQAALERISEGPYELIERPVNVCAEFVFDRHPSQWLKSGSIRRGAPIVPVGDLDKLLRAVCDSMSGTVYKDDRQVVGFDGSYKRFAETNESAGVSISVMEVIPRSRPVISEEFGQ